MTRKPQIGHVLEPWIAVAQLSERGMASTSVHRRTTDAHRWVVNAALRSDADLATRLRSTTAPDAAQEEART